MVEISWELLAGFVIYVICTVVALARPSRGVQDVIAGTGLFRAEQQAARILTEENLLGSLPEHPFLVSRAEEIQSILHEGDR